MVQKYGTSVMLYQYWHIFSVKNCNRNVINQGIITIILIDKILFVLLQYDLWCRFTWRLLWKELPLANVMKWWINLIQIHQKIEMQ